ncbi:MAG: tripartite tricarboxylate transporter substrate binding protein [Hyphomicrobiales bacterium]|nr:tripartite tricarboxylate transporter substrate binding protein [Hyphomicrobiales bacterium]
MERRTFLRSAALAPLMAAASRLSAQTTWPAGPIELVVPFPPGGPTDTAPRLALEHLQPLLDNATLVVVNKAGAGGGVGCEQVARSRPDGQTLLATSNPPLSVRLAIDKKVTYKLDDFTPLGMYAVDVGILVARPELGIKTLEELVARVKQKPDELSYASAGQGTVTHVSTELFKHVAGLKIVHVPFRGSGPAAQAILGGHVPLMSSAYSAAKPLVERGDVVPLVITGARRLPELPNVPTLAEKGFKGAELNIWMGFFAPAATPQPIVQRLTQAVAEASRKPALRAALERSGMIAEYGDPARVRELLLQEHASVADLAKKVDLGS